MANPAFPRFYLNSWDGDSTISKHSFRDLSNTAFLINMLFSLNYRNNKYVNILWYVGIILISWPSCIDNLNVLFITSWEGSSTFDSIGFGFLEFHSL